MFITSSTTYKNQSEKDASIDIIMTAIRTKIKSEKKLFLIQKKAAEKYKVRLIPRPLLLATYKNLVSGKKIKENKLLFQFLRKRKIRTSSGIASVAVLTKFWPCPGKCIYCPSEKAMPKSYLSNEPAVMRAILADFDPQKQIDIRLRGFEVAGNSSNKIELIVMGGTFSALPKKYQLEFIIKCYKACNNYGRKSEIRSTKPETKANLKINEKELIKEQKKNEKSGHRIVGLTLETRPDYINKKEIDWFRKLGCTRVELGVQSIYDRILTKNKRGHLVDATINATKLLKDAGFKVSYHLMPNLYGSDFKTDIKMFKDIFSKQEFQPDLIKIYPCMLTKYSDLEKLYKQGKFIPYTDAELVKLMIAIKKNLPPYVRVQRLYRDIPGESIIAGSKLSNLRQILQEKMKEKNISCNCIRCREIRHGNKKDVFLSRIDYNASNGKEIFLQFVDKDKRLYSLLRLRINFNNTAIIREVHTYGDLVEVGENKTEDAQHKGLGRKLISEAEKIARDEFGIKKIAVIAGVGVRDYYRKLEYRLEKTYMTKRLN